MTVHHFQRFHEQLGNQSVLLRSIVHRTLQGGSESLLGGCFTEQSLVHPDVLSLQVRCKMVVVASAPSTYNVLEEALEILVDYSSELEDKPTGEGN